MPCPVGSATNTSGAASALDCVATPGHYASNGQFHACPEGYFCTGQLASPIRCPSGFVCPPGTSNFTAMCQAGYYGAPPDCIQCPMLTTSLPGSARCDCMPGYFNASTIVTTSVTNATRANATRANATSSRANASRANTTSSRANASRANTTSSRANTTSSRANTTSSYVANPTSSYVANATSSYVANTTSSYVANTTGSYVATSNTATSANSSTSSNAVCVAVSNCPPNYFCPDAGPPLRCPPNSTAPPGATSLDQCQCLYGLAINASALCGPTASVSSIAMLAGIAGGSAVVIAGATWAGVTLSHAAVGAASMMGTHMIGPNYLAVKID